MMGRTKPWEVSDSFWSLAEPLVPTGPRAGSLRQDYTRKPGGGRKPTYTARQYFSAMVYVLRNGIIWNALPRETFGGLSSAAVHRKFRQWARAGFFERLWKKGLAEYDEMEGIAWQWLSADGTNVEAPLAQESVGPNPTDRGKKWEQAKRPRRRAWNPAVRCRLRGKPS
jgi:transposase